MQENNTVQHNIIIESRRLLNITGVNEINSYDENMVVANTSMGELTVKGSSLNVNNLNLQSGELNIMGEISALYYNVSKEKSSIISKIFK